MQRILVCLKRVVDYNVRVRVTPSGVVTDGAKMSINPFDEIALEEALRLRESGNAGEIIVASIGGSEVHQQLRTGLAMGADRAVHLESAAPLEPISVARTLRALVERETPDLVLLGKQSIDGDNNQTGQMLAALWQRPQACFASKLEVSGATLIVTREVDAGLETVEVDLPAVVTTDLRLNEPRYVKLPEMLKAKRKPLDVIPLAELGVVPTAQFRTLETRAPAPRPPGVKVATVAELIAELQKRGILQ